MTLLLIGWSVAAFVAHGALGRAPMKASASSHERDELSRLFREAADYSGFGLPKPARVAVEQAAELAERLGEQGLHARAIAILGTVYALEGDEAGARESWGRALEEARTAGDRSAEAAVRAEMGVSAWKRGSYEDALGHLREAERLSLDARDSVGAARAIGLAGRVAFKQARYDEGLELHRRALKIQQEAGDLRGQAVTLEDMADVYQEQGLYAVALEHYGRALRASEELGDRRRQSYLVTLLGKAFMLQGAYRRAIAHFEVARAMAEEAEDLFGKATAHHHLGIAHLRLGLPSEAVTHYEEALRAFEPLGDLREQAWVRSRIGDALVRMGDRTRALEAYRLAIELWEQIGDERGLGNGLEKYAGLLAESGERAEALKLLEKARILRERSQPAFLPSVLAQIARIHAETGEPELALRYADRALEQAREGKAAVLWSTAHEVSAVRLRLGLREEALSALEESLEAIERLRAGVSPSDDAKTGFLDSKQEVYADAIALLTELGRSEEALEVAERGRARAFLDLLGSGTTEVQSYPGSGRSEPASRETLRAVTLEEIREETRRRKTAVLEYFCTKYRLFMWLVQPDGTVHSAVSPIGRRDLARLIEQMRQTIPGALARDGLDQLERGGEASASALQAPDPRPALRKLWRVAIHPVSRWLPRNPEHTVTIVPHGPLFLVSFAALVDEAGQYLIERHTLHYAPSVAVLARMRGRHRPVPPEKLTLLVVGNPRMPHLPGRLKALAPLPGAESEAREVAALFPASRVRTLTGQEARESLVRRLAPDWTVLHFATHGVVFDDEPLESLIALAPESALPAEAEPARAIFRGETAARLPAISDRDGLWTAREVFPMALHAELVTLSACNTALGHISGDGVAGLSRAFFAAGTPSVLASLWRVADVAGRFQMERFYRSLRSNGGDKAAALRQAQLDTLQRLRTKRLRIPSGKPLPEQPIFWAPFVLIGEPL